MEAQEIIHIWKLISQDQIDYALQLSRIAVKKHPADADALTLLAGILNRLEKYHESIEIGELAAQMSPTNIGARLTLSDSYVDIGNYNQAIRHADEAIRLIETGSATGHHSNKIHENLRSAGYTLWMALDLSGDRQRAIDVARKLSENPTDTGLGHGMLMKSLVAVGNLDLALNSHLLRNKNYRIALFDIATILSHYQKYELAAEYFLRSLSLTKLPRNFDGLIAYLECSYHADNYNQVILSTSYWLEDVHAIKGDKRFGLTILSALSHFKNANMEKVRELFAQSSRTVKFDTALARFRFLILDETYDAINDMIAYINTDK